MKSNLAKALVYSGLCLLLVTVCLKGQTTVQKEQFTVIFSKAGVSSLKHTGDAYDTDYIAANRTLGHVRIRYQVGENEWKEFSTADPKNTYTRRAGNPNDSAVEHIIIYNQSGWTDYFADIELTEKFRVDDDVLYWSIHLKNLTHKPLEIGDLQLLLPFNSGMRWDREISYTQRVFQHRFISGHGSFLFWMRPNGVGPYLVMTPVATCPEFEPTTIERNFKPSKLEYSERGSVFIHAAGTLSEQIERGGNWRQPVTSAVLSPKFTPNDEITYAFRFRWADGYERVRDVLYEEGLMDVHVVPGMTVPEDLEALFTLRSSSPIHEVVPEFPQQTELEYLGEKAKDTHAYRVKFSRLGENKLTVEFGKSQSMILEFFATEPLETLIKKRAAFIVEKHQHRDPAKWYNGLFSDWDMRNKILRSPEDTGGLRDYMVAADDPGLCKAPYVAGKNVDYPVAREIEAVEYYLENYVWGKLQATHQEKHPYAVYGIPNWKVNRDSKPADRDGWTEHVWRVFDYPHVVHLYWNMYRVAKYYPDLVHYLDQDGYLERAFGTAKAYYTVPLKVAGWSAYEVGNYDELVIADLIEELYAVGWTEKADWLRQEWENKVEHFVNDQPNLFHSEFPFDPTGFESHHAFAKYAAEQLGKNGATLEVTSAAVARFSQEEITGNIATRGWLEPAYHQLGTERYNLRYMAQMGGWAILDHGLYFAADPIPFLRLGYASYLSSWALMNTGRPGTNYGYWYPGEDNDGGAGSAFLRSAYGRSWSGIAQPRGPWPYSSEIDLGFGAALRTAATIVADDPLFGLIALGGRLERRGDGIEVWPRDGLRRRFHIMRGDQRVHLLLDRDGFARQQPVTFDDALTRIAFTLENRAGRSHETDIEIAGLPVGAYRVRVGDNLLTTLRSHDGASAHIRVPVDSGFARVTITRIESSRF